MLCAALAAPAPAAEPGSTAGLPEDGRLEAEQAIIGEVRIEVGDIFDLDDPEDRLPGSRWVNRLHPTTRREVIARQLLFRTGDRYSRSLLEESERLLRGDRYLRDVVVRPIGYEDGRVAVEVRARDVWTLNAGLSIGRAGGATSTRVAVEDSNFLGTGKSVLFERRDDVDRTTNRLGYADPALLGSRLRLELGYAGASDGGGWRAELERPFYALDARWSAAIEGADDERVETLYHLGRPGERFGHRATRFELRGGLSKGRERGEVTRWTAGLSFQRDRFEALDGTAAPAPPERTLAYPWLGWEWRRDTYRESRNLDQIGRVEDLPLGPHLRARLGIASPALGADRSALIFDAGSTWVLTPEPRNVLRFDSAVSGRWERQGLTHTLLHAGARSYWRVRGEHLLLVALEGDLARALDPEFQLTLGGDSGLRGYPLRYQAGEARLALTVEQRFFTPWHLLRLARVGAAVFYDVGRIWGGIEEDRRGLLQDVGVGLRLAPTRTGRGGVLHLDVALPLGGPPESQRVQWLMRSRSTF